MENLSKMDDLGGHHYFRKHPYVFSCLSKLFGQKNSEFSKPWKFGSRDTNPKRSELSETTNSLQVVGPLALSQLVFDPVEMIPTKTTVSNKSHGWYMSQWLWRILCFSLLGKRIQLYFAGHLPGPSTIRGGCCQSGTFDAQCVVVDCGTHFVNCKVTIFILWWA